MSTDAMPRSTSTGTSDNSVFGFCMFLGISATLATGQLFGYLGFVPKLSEEFGGRVALGLPLFSLGYAFGMILIGSLAARFGPQKVMIVSLGLGGLVSIATAFSTSLPMLLTLRFCEGTILGGFPPAAFVASAQKIPPKKILFANSAMAFGLLGSAGVAGLITKIFTITSNWRTGLIIYGILLLLAGLTAWMQTGLVHANPEVGFPYRHFSREIANKELLFSAFFGASTMAVFVFANSTAQRSSVAVAALILVAVIVLMILGLSKRIVTYAIDTRRLAGLGFTLSGLLILTVWNGALLPALCLITIGATLTIPASIQNVVMNARRVVPVAVALFTCSLFIGGAVVGMSVTGIVQIQPSTVLMVLDCFMVLAFVTAVSRYLRTKTTQ